MRVGGIQGAHEVGEELDEHEIGQAPCDLLLPKPAFVERKKMEGAAVGGLLDEGGAAEHQREHAKPMVALARRVRSAGRRARERRSGAKGRSPDILPERDFAPW